jgi:hypothetical protein
MIIEVPPSPSAFVTSICSPEICLNLTALCASAETILSLNSWNALTADSGAASSAGTEGKAIGAGMSMSID